MYDKKEMFQATCSECGQSCEVPFRPTGDKPVLCSTCFGKQKDKFQGRSGGRNFGRSSDRQMHTAVCDKCGKKAEVPFKPTGDKPIFCSDCFKKEDRRGGDRHGGRDRDGVGNKQLSEQMKSISNKLDKLIDLLDPDATKKETPAKDSSKKPEPKKPEVKKKTAKKPVKKKVKPVVKKK